MNLLLWMSCGSLGIFSLHLLSQAGPERKWMFAGNHQGRWHWNSHRETWLQLRQRALQASSQWARKPHVAPLLVDTITYQHVFLTMNFGRDQNIPTRWMWCVVCLWTKKEYHLCVCCCAGLWQAGRRKMFGVSLWRTYPQPWNQRKRRGSRACTKMWVHLHHIPWRLRAELKSIACNVHVHTTDFFFCLFLAVCTTQGVPQ